LEKRKEVNPTSVKETLIDEVTLPLPVKELIHPHHSETAHSCFFTPCILSNSL